MLWHNYIYQVSGSLNVSEHQSRSEVSESVQINPNFDCKFTDKNFSSKVHTFRRRFFLTSYVWHSVRQCWHWKRLDTYNRRHSTWASYQIRKIAGCACAGNVGIVFPHPRFQGKPLVSDPDMHHCTCVTHVPWCMSGSLTCGDGENVPGIPGACAPAILRIWQEAHGNMNVSHCLPAFKVVHVRQTSCSTFFSIDTTQNHTVQSVHIT